MPPINETAPVMVTRRMAAPTQRQLTVVKRAPMRAVGMMTGVKKPIKVTGK